MSSNLRSQPTIVLVAYNCTICLNTQCVINTWYRQKLRLIFSYYNELRKCSVSSIQIYLFRNLIWIELINDVNRFNVFPLRWMNYILYWTRIIKIMEFIIKYNELAQILKYLTQFHDLVIFELCMYMSVLYSSY